MERSEDEYFEFEAEVESKRIDPYTGKVAKFKMDKFYGKEMEISKQILSETQVNEWLDWLEHVLPRQFKRNNINTVGSIGKPDPLPPVFQIDNPDHYILAKSLEAADKADIRSIEAEKLAQKKKKERLKLFMSVIKDYLQSLSPSELSDHRWNNPDYISPYTKHGKLKPGYNKDGTLKDKSK